MNVHTNGTPEACAQAADTPATPAQHEAALAKAEAALEEDAASFDAFLKDNDEKVQAALRRADAESKAKQEKVSELKRQTLALGIEQSELRKVQDRLDECRRHAAFLDRVTPPDWFAAQTARNQAEWQVWCCHGRLSCLPTVAC
jgi:hypothetical protein